MLNKRDFVKNNNVKHVYLAPQSTYFAFCFLRLLSNCIWEEVVGWGLKATCVLSVKHSTSKWGRLLSEGIYVVYSIS